ncbi:NirD/YgiW/YdeI family stress tolerance protein [Bibersteinia trehalosi]|uniref:YgiW/YdeI family stress tolerance OB fold protein n=1 Tax=Bibersteinia trehalosi TaxID=47735 RepID=UPI003D284120
MKKLITLSTLLVVSSFAVAQGGFEDPNDARTYKANEQERAEMKREKLRKHGKQDGKYGDKKGIGFFDENNAVKSVKDLPAAKDKSFVLLEGNITKRVGKKDFIFKDATGEVEIEVSRRAWQGQTITPTDRIQIRGVLDKEWDKAEVEVMEIIKK